MKTDKIYSIIFFRNMKATCLLILLIVFQVDKNIYGQSNLSVSLHEKITLNINAELVSDSGDDTVEFKELVNKGTKLIIRYSNINWGMCNAADLININRIAGKIGEENIILITAPSHPNHLALFKDANAITIPVYQFIDDNLAIPLEAENIPFLFIADQNKYARYLFIPDFDDVNRTDEYLEYIHERFFGM